MAPSASLPRLPSPLYTPATMFSEIMESLRKFHLENARTWLVGFSGGNVNSYYDAPHDATDCFDFVLACPPFNDSLWFRKDTTSTGSSASRRRGMPTSHGCHTSLNMSPLVDVNSVGDLLRML